MSLIQLVKFREMEMRLDMIPRLEHSLFETGVFEKGFTVASGQCFITHSVFKKM